MRTWIGPPASAVLRLDGRCDRVGGASENATKNASPCVSTSTPSCAANASRSDAAMLGEQVGVRVTVLVQQLGRSLDVREEECHGAGRKVAHGAPAAYGDERRPTSRTAFRDG